MRKLENDADRKSGLLLGSEPLEDVRRRSASKGDDGKDGDTGDDDSTDSDKTDSDATDTGDGLDDAGDSDGKD